MHSILHRFAEQSMSLSTVLLMNLAAKPKATNCEKYIIDRYIDENCPISLDIYFIRSTKINDIYNIQPYLVEDKASSELSEIER